MTKEEKLERGRKHQKAWRDRNRESERIRAEKKNWRKLGARPTRERPGACECCGRVPKRSLDLDHLHGTMVFRGWLCNNCNRGIGLLGDGLSGVRKALEYLERSDALERLRRMHN